MVDQVEFADVILINKCDVLKARGEAGEVELKAVTELVKTLNPTAKLIPTEFGKTDLNNIMDTKMFDMAKAGIPSNALGKLSYARSPLVHYLYRYFSWALITT